MFLYSSFLDKRLEKQCWTLQQWLTLAVDSARDANADMEKGER